jgi:excisionase family DNA binding protein
MEQKLSAPTAGFPFGLSINDTVLISGLGRDTIYRAIRDGRLKARKVGRRTLVLRTDLEAFLSGLPQLHLGGLQPDGACSAPPHPASMSRRGRQW